jgi:hypothetical protein
LEVLPVRAEIWREDVEQFEAARGRESERSHPRMLPAARRCVHAQGRLGCCRVTTIRLDSDTADLDGFPPEFTVLGRDDLGDVLASDAKSKVWWFPHGHGNWNERSVAFASRAQLDAYLKFQHWLATDDAAADLPTLQAKRQALRAFRKSQPRAPYTKDAIDGALESLRDEIADRRWHATAKGKQLAARQELGLRCEHALRDADAPGTWLVRAHASNPRALVAMGNFTAPWTEAKVRALLQPLLGERFELVCSPRPHGRPSGPLP